MIVTARLLAEALHTYPADAEVFLDGHTLHAHIGEECHEVWSDDSPLPHPPLNYHPIFTVEEK